MIKYKNKNSVINNCLFLNKITIMHKITEYVLVNVSDVINKNISTLCITYFYLQPTFSIVTHNLSYQNVNSKDLLH